LDDFWNKIDADVWAQAPGEYLSLMWQRLDWHFNLLDQDDQERYPALQVIHPNSTPTPPKDTLEEIVQTSGMNKGRQGTAWVTSPLGRPMEISKCPKGEVLHLRAIIGSNKEPPTQLRPSRGASAVAEGTPCGTPRKWSFI
jgi:hypothetical protein